MFTIKNADSENEFQQVHQLNYATFVNEIPQHSTNSKLLLVDKFHPINTYILAKENDKVIGMLAYNSKRPFSIDYKLENIECYLPVFKNPVEIRLLAIAKDKRNSRILYLLLKELVQQLSKEEHDIVLISGTTRQLKLYHKIGFVDFAHLVGGSDALYQPMYLTKNTIHSAYINEWISQSI